MTSPIEDRIALLQVRAQAQRLAAQLAIGEARDQLRPLRAAAGSVGALTRALSPERPAGALMNTLGRLAIRHPWLGSMLAASALRLLRRRPFAVVLAAGAGAAAWWFLHPPGARGLSEETGE